MATEISNATVCLTWFFKHIHAQHLHAHERCEEAAMAGAYCSRMPRSFFFAHIGSSGRKTYHIFGDVFKVVAKKIVFPGNVLTYKKEG